MCVCIRAVFEFHGPDGHRPIESLPHSLQRAMQLSGQERDGQLAPWNAAGIP